MIIKKGNTIMKCWHCNSELIWGGDSDLEEDDENYSIETNLSCPKCEAFVLVYLPKDKSMGEV